MTGEAWEYHRETLGGLFQAFDIDRRLMNLLNRLGAEGWELVSHRQSWLTKRHELVFKRARRLSMAADRVA